MCVGRPLDSPHPATRRRNNSVRVTLLRHLACTARCFVGACVCDGGSGGVVRAADVGGEREKLVHLFWTGWLAGFAHDGPFAVVTCASWPYRKTWILELIPWATATHHSEGLQGKCCRTSNDQVVYGSTTEHFATSVPKYFPMFSLMPHNTYCLRTPSNQCLKTFPNPCSRTLQKKKKVPQSTCSKYPKCFNCYIYKYKASQGTVRELTDKNYKCLLLLIRKTLQSTFTASRHFVTDKEHSTS